MRTIRGLELVSGWLSGIVGLLGLADFLFGPAYQYQSSTGASGYMGAIEAGAISAEAAVVLSVVALAFISVIVAATARASSGASSWRPLLWFATAVLLVFTTLGMLSVGLLLLPGTLLAVLTCGFSLIQRRPAAQ
jgi:hypothetical protein